MTRIHAVQSPDRSVLELKGVGEKVAEKLSTIGINGINDVLFHLPSSYTDQSLVDLHQADHGANITVAGTVKTEPHVAFFRKGMSRLTSFMDAHAIYVKVTYFNQPYLKKNI